MDANTGNSVPVFQTVGGKWRNRSAAGGAENLADQVVEELSNTAQNGGTDFADLWYPGSAKKSSIDWRKICLLVSLLSYCVVRAVFLFLLLAARPVLTTIRANTPGPAGWRSSTESLGTHGIAMPC